MRRPIARDINQRKRAVSGQVANWVNTINPLDYKPSLWLDASDTTTITESSGSVSQWNDKSGNDFHVVQGTAASQPKTGTRTINNLNVIDFDITTVPDYLARSTNSQLVDSAIGIFTSFAVWQSDTTANNGGVISQDAGSGTRMPQMIRRASNVVQTVRIAGGVVVDAAGVTVTTATTYITAAQHRPTNIEAWVNGSSNGASATTGSNGTVAAPIYVGSVTLTSESFDGVIGEIIVIPRNLTNLEMNQIGTYLVRKWAGTWTWF